MKVHISKDPEKEAKKAKQDELAQKRKDGKKLTLDDIYDQQQLVLAELSTIRKQLQVRS